MTESHDCKAFSGLGCRPQRGTDEWRTGLAIAEVLERVRGLAFALLIALASCGTPVIPVEEEVPFATISAGHSSHICALATDGSAYCWGNNSSGQLGSGPSAPLFAQALPVSVVSGLAFAAVSAGGSHTCALDRSGRAYCWGWNRDGQLGIGSLQGPESCGLYACASAPEVVSGDLEFASISAGTFHTCALGQTGDVYCWGANDDGQLGSGPTGPDASHPTPTRVSEQPQV
jgi:alpha-tubulin suppressor-like RCC1 family protein